MEDLSGSASGWANSIGGLASGIGSIVGSLKDNKVVEKRIPEPRPAAGLGTNTLLLIGGAIVAVFALIFFLKK